MKLFVFVIGLPFFLLGIVCEFLWDMFQRGRALYTILATK